VSEKNALRRPAPLYRPDDDGLIVVYVGELQITADEDHLATVTGQLELRLSPRTSFRAHFAGPLSEFGPVSRLGSGGRDRTVTIPDGAALTPPAEPLAMERPDERSWVEDDIWVSGITAGELSRAERFLFHFSSGFPPKFRGRGHGSEHINFVLPGWNLVVAPRGTEAADERDFGGVVQAVPDEEPSIEDIQTLTDRLYVLLSFVAGREIGIAPTCGVDAEDDVVWAEWRAPRLRLGQSSAWWSPPIMAPAALREVADGFGQLVADPALEKAAHRAVDHLLAADSDEVLDVRIPVACSGLELLSWVVLRRHGWLGQDSFQQLTAAARVRLLLQWAEVPTSLPDHFAALIARLDRLQQSEWEAPEILFNVRNGLIHPPRRLTDPEWPSLDEMVEAWQFATWALQLVLLRLIGYAGQYWSRLRLGRPSLDVEPVPWAADDPNTGGN
jgi:hypothetical protein